MANSFINWWDENWRFILPSVIALLALIVVVLWMISGDTAYNDIPSSTQPAAVAEPAKDTESSDEVPAQDNKAPQSSGGTSIGG